MNNKWIEHTHDMCPVPLDTLVQVRTLNDPSGLHHEIAPACSWLWELKEQNRITHYRLIEEQPEQSSGGDNDYYVANITNPKRLEPCRVECEDVIQALGMTFGQGEAFKAIWRDAAAKLGNGKPGDTAMRNAEKVIHYGEYMKRDAQ